jgi:hypothetical protein
MVTTALLKVWSDCLEATGTDTYTIGRDECRARDFQSNADPGDMPIQIELDRDGWRDIEAQARKDKGYTGRLEFIPGDALIFHPGGPKAEKGVAQDKTGKGTTQFTNRDTLDTRDIWDLCDELLTVLQSRELQVPHIFTLDPSLLVRFNKVRSSGNADRVMDFNYQGEGHAILVKIGPTFIGAIMPIDREVYAANQDDGQEGLW